MKIYGTKTEIHSVVADVSPSDVIKFLHQEYLKSLQFSTDAYICSTTSNWCETTWRTETVNVLRKATGEEIAIWDAFRRLVQAFKN